MTYASAAHTVSLQDTLASAYIEVNLAFSESTNPLCVTLPSRGPKGDGRVTYSIFAFLFPTGESVLQASARVFL